MTESCYNCGAVAATEDHEPPVCFFPEGYRSGLVKVPSCAEHNTALSEDVEYVRNALCGQHGTNLVATKVFYESAKRSYDRSQGLFYRTFSETRPINLDGQETMAFSLDLPRFKRVIKAIAYAMYYHDFGKRNEGDFDVFSPTLHSRSNLYYGSPDGFEHLRSILEKCVFKSMPVPQPKVFKYGMSYPGEGQVHYKFEFYEGFVVYALTLRHRLTPLLYLPVTGDLRVFRRG